MGQWVDWGNDRAKLVEVVDDDADEEVGDEERACGNPRHAVRVSVRVRVRVTVRVRVADKEVGDEERAW